MLLVRYYESGTMSAEKLQRLAQYWNIDTHDLTRADLRRALMNSPHNRVADGPTAYEQRIALRKAINV